MKLLSTGTRFGLAVLRALLRGGFRLSGGHLPPAGHQVPEDFAGIGVAAGPDAAHDELQLAHLARLGVRRVRIDYTYGDADRPAGRLLIQKWTWVHGPQAGDQTRIDEALARFEAFQFGP